MGGSDGTSEDTGVDFRKTDTEAVDPEGDPGEHWTKPEGARIRQREINLGKITRLLEENQRLGLELHGTSDELQQAQREHDELEVRWKASCNLAERQKLVTQSLLKNLQHASRSDLQNAVENAQTITELEEVLRRLQVVHRQLRFAIDMQKQASEESGRRLAARARKIRKLELALFAIVAQAQCDPRTQECVAGLVSKAGPLIQSVLSREANRQALDLTAKEHADKNSQGSP
eukprot:TRINITY_DN14606_c0_g1_i1.p2 TRINITY_DN14606_c0_g1~~TRINITY_DN14606_c0_g1_i1.p2  ORF type:complete len:232 (-),score=75.43 TRINITY_DN14606_c0_g1_i1:51-746(-)